MKYWLTIIQGCCKPAIHWRVQSALNATLLWLFCFPSSCVMYLSHGFVPPVSGCCCYFSQALQQRCGFREALWSLSERHLQYCQFYRNKACNLLLEDEEARPCSESFAQVRTEGGGRERHFDAIFPEKAFERLYCKHRNTNQSCAKKACSRAHAWSCGPESGGAMATTLPAC